MSKKKTLEYWREVCSAKPGTTEETPFGPETLVYKVAGKMFALIGLTPPLSMNLKCDPQEALIIRDSFSGVTPGYHMNKKHWNTVDLDGSIAPELIEGWIDDSFQLVVKGLPRSVQQALTEPPADHD